MTEIGKYIEGGRFQERFLLIEDLIRKTRNDMKGNIEDVPEEVLGKMDRMVDELAEIRNQVYQRKVICPSWEVMEHTWKSVADLEERLKDGPVMIKLEGRQKEEEE